MPVEQILWIGSEGGMEADLVKRAGVPFATIPAAGVHGVGWRALPGNLWRLSRGFSSARRVLERFQPDVLFFTGGYLAVPMALAGRLPSRGRSRPRSMLYVPDIEPGLALKTLAKFADQIAVTVEESRSFFKNPGRVVKTGYPTRPDLAVWNKEQAVRALSLSSDIPILLVFGGSSGARSLNRALLGVLPELLGDMQVIHISGRLDWEEVEENRRRLEADFSDEYPARYRAYPYLHEEMGAAMVAADLVVSRSGASCLGEFPLFGLPAILVPYPHAWQYQAVNARYLEEHGAAVILKDSELPGQLLPTVRRLINDPQTLTQMRKAMRVLAQPQAAQRIACLLSSLATSGRGAA
jgi:UDP-N-acetylglucosamine--N-acetylmuramyl-(pentapeptide) pyrophosphoryl-undecaprenol N-acetylglucosamine transferase